ncbi:hypothetical protein [Streptomyces sp. NPDC057557]|uniref:hypothetical protein n=1 Tax=Streptomyces sp. NPDC057557 TaxID=3346167 RepID=UPI0036AB97E0
MFAAPFTTGASGDLRSASSVSSRAEIWSWGVIVVCHLVYRRRVERGEAPASTFRLPYAKALCRATLAFLAALTILLAFDEGRRIALYAPPVWAAVLIGSYRMSSPDAARKEHVPARAPSAL